MIIQQNKNTIRKLNRNIQHYIVNIQQNYIAITNKPSTSKKWTREGILEWSLPLSRLNSSDMAKEKLPSWQQRNKEYVPSHREI